MAQQRTPARGGRLPAWGGPPWRWWYGGQPGPGGRGDEEDGRRAGARWPWITTLLLTVLVYAGSHFAARGQPDRAPLDTFARVLLVAGTALLLWRLRHPVAVLFGTALAVLLYLGAGYPYGPFLAVFAVACFGAVVSGHRRAAWTAVGALWAGHLLVAHWLYARLPPPGDGPAGWGGELAIAAWVLAVMALSELARNRREQWAHQRAERARAARRRADEERLRIARELHDVLAHSISVINVQAGMGLALLDADPEQARAALTTIKAASKEALGEVRHVLDTLRAPGAAPRAPAPGLDRLPELVDQAAGAGLTVRVGTEREPGAPDTLPPGLDLAAFRIVQEALTNVVRHSGSRQARVEIRHGTRALHLRVDDDGPATGAEAGGSGNGLAGMRERAAALGGTIEAGTRADGGFTVSATLPRKPRGPREEDG